MNRIINYSTPISRLSATALSSPGRHSLSVAKTAAVLSRNPSTASALSFQSRGIQTSSKRPLTSDIGLLAIRPGVRPPVPSSTFISKRFASNNSNGPNNFNFRMNPNQQGAEEAKSALEEFGVDLTALAKSGKLDNVIGRDKEIKRVIQILSRRTKITRVFSERPV